MGACIGAGLAAATFSSTTWASGSGWFEWAAPDGCPAREVVLERVRAYVPGEPDDEVQARVQVDAEDGAWTGRIAVAAGTSRSERTVQGLSCEAVADASAMIVGLALAPTAPTPAPDPPTVDAPVPVAVRPASAVQETPASSINHRPGGPSAHAGALFDGGALPSAAPGVEVGVGWRVAPIEVGLEAAAFAAQRGTVAGSASGASMTMESASLDACLVVPWGDRVVVAPCAGFALERLAAEGFGPPGAFLTARPVVVLPAVLGEMGLEWSPSSRVAIRVAARGVAPFARPAFVVGGPGGGDVYRPALVALEPSLGLVVRLGK